MPIFVLITRRVGGARRKIATTRQESMADISSLVQESLSVSGILLGKTMGRSTELAERFEGESNAPRRPRGAEPDDRPLADAVDPDHLRGHAGADLLVRRARGRSTPPARRRTRRSARSSPSRPSRRGCSRRSGACSRSRSTSRARWRSSTGSSSTSTCRSTSRRARRRSSKVHGDVRLDDVWFRYGDGPYALESVDITIPAGTTTAVVGETGAGKTTLGYLVSRLYDVSKGQVTIDGIDIRELTFESLAVDGRRRLAGDLSLPRDRAREPALREARRDRRGGRGGGARGADPRADLVAARGLRDGRRRARLPLLGRREAADGDRARDPAQPADPRPRRGDLGARHPDRARRPGGARAARRGAHDDRDRPPALDRPRRRPDRRPRRRPRRRDGHLRRARRPRRPLRRARGARRRTRSTAPASSPRSSSVSCSI